MCQTALVWLAVTVSLFHFYPCAVPHFTLSLSQKCSEFMAFSKTRLQSYSFMCLNNAVNPEPLLFYFKHCLHSWFLWWNICSVLLKKPVAPHVNRPQACCSDCLSWLAEFSLASIFLIRHYCLLPCCFFSSFLCFWSCLWHLRLKRKCLMCVKRIQFQATSTLLHFIFL